MADRQHKKVIRLAKLANHVKNNPRDYQSLIAFYKLRSDQIDHENRQKQVERIRLIRKCKEKLNEKRVSEQFGGQ